MPHRIRAADEPVSGRRGNRAATWRNIFLKDDHGRRPVYGGSQKFQDDPHWHDCLLFYEYFHGDNGAGLGASHQTGWTGVIARIMHLFATMTADKWIGGRKESLYRRIANPRKRTRTVRRHERRKSRQCRRRSLVATYLDNRHSNPSCEGWQMDYTRLDQLPLWGLFIATIAVVILAIEAGYRLGQYRRRRSDQEKDAPVGAIVAATLGLLAFMLAFTFGLAATRFDARRMVVLEESNAIGTANLRAGLLPEPNRSEIRKLFREYVDVRLEAVKPDATEQAISKSTALHRALWSQASDVAANDNRSILTGIFVQSLNEVIDLHAKRVMLGLRNRIPGAGLARALFHGDRLHGRPGLSGRTVRFAPIARRAGAGINIFGRDVADRRSRPAAGGAAEG